MHTAFRKTLAVLITLATLLGYSVIPASASAKPGGEQEKNQAATLGNSDTPAILGESEEQLENGSPFSSPYITIKPVEYYSHTTTTEKREIDFSANNVVDWVHFNALPNPNKKDSTEAKRMSFSGTGTKDLSYGTNWNNSAISYDDGVLPATAFSSPNYIMYTGLNSTATFTAPSKQGVKRVFTVYLGSWAAKEISVAVTMGGESIAAAPTFALAEKVTKLAQYTIEYTGTAAEDALQVTFTLTDASLDTKWSSVGFSGAMITEGIAVAQKKIVFTSPELKNIGTSKYAIVVPPSGRVRRDIPAALYDETGTEVPNPTLNYTLETPKQGAYLEGDMLSITSEFAESAVLKVRVEDTTDPTVFAVKEIDVIKNDSLKDFPANPLEKNGYQLFHSSEFDEGIDPRYWSDYYLRSWSEDEMSKSHTFIEDGNLVLTAPRDIAPRWSIQDGYQRVIAISTFEKQHLHQFSAAVESREIPVFDGMATKYGYFEVRMKMPNTRDGSHFAWWMVGTQDDQHPTVSLANDPSTLYPKGPGGWGVEDYFWSNQGAEYDIVEQHIDPIKNAFMYDRWYPVIHKNGTRDYAGRWYAGADVPAKDRVQYSKKGADPYNEFHIYGFDWDENGTRFYLDNELVYTSTHTAGYRMMTILSLYSGASVINPGAYGDDRGIYPKDASIDYFRIYKKDQAPTPTSLVLNDYNTPYYFKVPTSGTATVAMKVYALDQFDEEIPLTDGQAIKWCFAGDIGGEKGRTTSLNGVLIDENTGVVTITKDAPLNQDLFVTAYAVGDGIESSRKVYETRHVKLSTDTPKPRLVAFDTKTQTVSAGSTTKVVAKAYDQYMNAYPSTFTYQLSTDITGIIPTDVAGITVDSLGNLTVDSSVPEGTTFIVTADSGHINSLNGSLLQVDDPILQNLVIRVENTGTTLDYSELDAVITSGEALLATTPENTVATGYQELIAAVKVAKQKRTDATAQDELATAAVELQAAIDGIRLKQPETVDLNDVKQKVLTALDGFTATNDTTKETISQLIRPLLPLGVTEEWKTFVMVPAVAGLAGTITGEIELVHKASTKGIKAVPTANRVTVPIHLTIQPLPVTPPTVDVPTGQKPTSSAGTSTPDKNRQTTLTGGSQKETILQPVTIKEIQKQLANAKKQKPGAPTLLLKNKLALPKNAVETLASLQAGDKQEIVIEAQTTFFGSSIVQGKLLLKPKQMAAYSQDLALGVFVELKTTQTVNRLFEKFFANQLESFEVKQVGAFPEPVEIAVATRFLSKDVPDLVVYRYDMETNTYQLIKGTKIEIENGFATLTLATGGIFILSKGVLQK